MAFSKESFDISQYKTGWLCAKKGFSKEKVSSIHSLWSKYLLKRNHSLIMVLENVIKSIIEKDSILKILIGIFFSNILRQKLQLRP